MQPCDCGKKAPGGGGCLYVSFCFGIYVLSLDVSLGLFEEEIC